MNIKNNKNAWLFFLGVIILYLATSIYYSYQSAKTPINADLSEEEKAMCALETLSGNRVSLTVPPTYALNVTQADLDEAAKKNGYESITLNPDKSVTYTITAEQHSEMLSELRSGVIDKIKAMPKSDTKYSDVKEIKYNEDFTDFEIYTSTTNMDDNMSMVSVNLKMLSTMYNAFNGVGNASFHSVYYGPNNEKVAEIG